MLHFRASIPRCCHVFLRVGLLSALLLCYGGCRRTSGTGSESAGAAAAQIFQQRCVACHGSAGKGDGPAAAALTPKPRDFTSTEWQKSMTDAAIEKIILHGGAAVGKSAAMPANPDLEGQAAVVSALREYVRGLSGK